jgi:prepilin peptidase CpaA
MIAQALLMILLPALLAAAAAFDLASFTIPNLISLALVLAFLLFGLAAHFSFAVFSLHLLAGMIALVLGFILFARGYIGGGDAKFFAAVALWLGLHDLLTYALVASLFGGLLTVTLLALRQLPLPASLARRDWILKLHEKSSGIPYGVALAAGALVLLPYAEILKLAASA